MSGIKEDIFSIAEKNRIIQNISEEIFTKNSFLLLGHKEPDADCISSLVAFALLLSKFHKEVVIFLVDPVIEQLEYLMAICRYNCINVIHDINADISNNFEAIIAIDTPKPGMLMANASVSGMLADPTIRKIEIDHHIGADANYIGDPGYRLVFSASSACEIVGYISLKLSRNPITQISGEEFFSRNLALSILTGIVADSQMGRYLKTKKERWYYNFFSVFFDKLLMEKTIKGGKNLHSMQNIFDVIQTLSRQEQACCQTMKDHLVQSASVHSIILGSNESEELFSHYGGEIIVNVAKSLTDELSEASGKLGLVAYCDDPRLSDLVQFRLRRSAQYTKLDLRTVISRLGITNGGGHQGAIGFRVKKSEIKDIAAYGEKLLKHIQEFIAEADSCG